MSEYWNFVLLLLYINEERRTVSILATLGYYFIIFIYFVMLVSSLSPVSSSRIKKFIFSITCLPMGAKGNLMDTIHHLLWLRSMIAPF